jgi:ADP-ribose pyrophosphatase YjhB (NUDIX family)
MHHPLADGAHYSVTIDGQTWELSWHPPHAPPPGRNEGSSGICVTADGTLIIVSADDITWDLPGGRPEAGEDLEATLRREVAEEACATVHAARLLGFARSICRAGREEGSVLVRAFWWAQVELLPFAPQFEIAHRRLVPVQEALDALTPYFTPIFARALGEAVRYGALRDPV